MKKADILFWKDKKVLITGHTGFVGTWMCIVLQRYGADISGLSLEAHKASLFEKVKNNLSIKNIGIIHNREFEGGVLRLEMYDGESLALAVALLKKHHYTIYER